MPTPTDNSWKTLYPFQSHWLELGGRRLHYIDQGPKTAPVLLFVHGNPTWSFHWRNLVGHLQQEYRCIAMDHLGSGLSDLPAQPLRLADHIDNLIRLVNKLDLNRVTLVAQDWGGAIGLGVMLACQERLERIVLFNTGAFPPPYIPWQIDLCRMPLLGKIALQGMNLFSRAALSMTLSRTKKLVPAVAAGYLAPYNSWRNRSAIQQFVADIPMSPDHPTWEALTDIEAQLPLLRELPICLIWGMRDWCFREECLQRFVKHWPNAKVNLLDDVGHWVVEDAPEESLALVENFLRSSSPDRVESSQGAMPLL